MASELAKIGSNFSAGAPDPNNSLFQIGTTFTAPQGAPRTIMDARLMQPAMRPAIANMRPSTNVEDARFEAPPQLQPEDLERPRVSVPPFIGINEFNRDMDVTRDRARMGVSLEDLGFGVSGGGQALASRE